MIVGCGLWRNQLFSRTCYYLVLATVVVSGESGGSEIGNFMEVIVGSGQWGNQLLSIPRYYLFLVTVMVGEKWGILGE